MSDHLLRLAKIVEELTYLHPDKSLARDAYQLVREIEAAPQPERPPSSVETALREFAGFISGDIAESVNRYLNASGPHVPPAPERRTITREEFRAAQEQVWRAQDNGENAETMLERVADVWRLTVEE